MPTPQGIQTVTMHGRFVEPDLLGTPLVGSVVFTPNVPMVTFPNENTLMSGTETATLDGNGEFTIDLPCTDTPDQNPDGWTYTVTEKLIGVRGRTYQIALPFTVAVVELADVTPTDAAPDYLPVTGPQGPPGLVTSVNGYSAADIVLNAADVGAVATAGDEVVGGVKDFTFSPLVPTPTTAFQAANKDYTDSAAGNAVAALESQVVKLAGAQDITGSKTLTAPSVWRASGEAEGRITIDPVAGKIILGDGTAAPETEIYRDEAFSVATLGTWRSYRSSGTSNSFSARVVGDTFSRWYVDADGSMHWGPGGATIADTELVRSAVGELSSSRLRLEAEDDVSLFSTAHAFQIGPSDGQNLRFDSNEISAVNNGVAGSLHLQYNGGITTLFGAKTAGSVNDTLDVRGIASFSRVISLEAPTAADHVTRKDYVDGPSTFTGLKTFEHATLGTGLVAQARVLGDTQSRWFMRADGEMQWGSGSAAHDVRVYRESASVLATEDNVRVYRATDNLDALSIRVAAETSSRFVVEASGLHLWGPGGGSAGDTTLYRSAANTLKTDDSLVVEGSLTVVGINGTKTLYKSADTSRANVTTISPDPDLSMPLLANAQYAFDGLLLYTSPSQTPDLLLALEAPAGAVGFWTVGAPTSGTTSDPDTIRVIASDLNAGRVYGVPTVNQSIGAQLTGFITMGGTAGNLNVSWAQNTSSASATIFKAGSWLRVTRVA